MFTRLLICTISLYIFAGPAAADFQYQSTSRVTGGALIQMMRFVPGGGALKEPQISTVALQGNRLVRRSKRQGEIIDLDKRTITTINFDKRTYTEMTFEQMKQMLDQASAAAAQKEPGGKNVELNIDADIKDTGQTKVIGGLDAHGFEMTMTMAATDPQSGQSGAMKINSEMWISKSIPGAGEMREFYKRMAKELDWAPTGMGALMNRPDIARAMSKMMAEGEKMDGTTVEQVVRMGMDGGSPDGGNQQSASAAARPSLGDALGGALGGKLGGLGGFGRKKKQDDQAAASPAADKPQAGGGSLMEMTIDDTGFSTNAVDSSLFDIPAGFKRVEEQLPSQRKK
jgi:hypothetical protein